MKLPKIKVDGFTVGWGLAVCASVAGALSEVWWIQALSWCVLAPTILFILFLVYGYVLYKSTQLLGGDPDDDWFGPVVFISFAVLVAAMIGLRH